MKTNYAGINYASGLNTNKNSETGIRYGVISQHSLMPEALDDIFTQGRDLSYEGYIEEINKNLRSVLSNYFSDWAMKSKDVPSNLDCAVENAFNAISDDIGYQSDSPKMLYESQDYSIETCSDNDLIVTKSPYFTYAQFCSPCVPGAFNLDSPLEQEESDNKCYCLGSDWFGRGESPV